MNVKSMICRLKVEFPDRSLTRPVLAELSQARDITVNILRGRVSSRNAWFELEIEGNPKKLDRVVRLVREWGSKVMYEPTPATCPCPA